MGYYSYKGIRPVVDSAAWVHPDASIIGEVIIDADVFIGANAVLRGDLGRIEVHSGANVQETCVLHSFPEHLVIIGKNAHIGHGAIIHGAKIGINAMVGMNAVIMDNVVIGKNSIIGALSFVKEGLKIAPNRLAHGNPVRDIRALTAEEIAWKSAGTEIYQELARARETIPTDPLCAQSNQGKKIGHKTHLPKNTQAKRRPKH